MDLFSAPLSQGGPSGAVLPAPPNRRPKGESAEPPPRRPTQADSATPPVNEKARLDFEAGLELEGNFHSSIHACPPQTKRRTVESDALSPLPQGPPIHEVADSMVSHERIVSCALSHEAPSGKARMCVTSTHSRPAHSTDFVFTA